MIDVYSLINAISFVKDPRIERTKKHKLTDIIVIAIYTLLCGAEGWKDMEDIACERYDELKAFLALDNGIPSHDTLQRVFSRLNPKELERALAVWMASLQGSLRGKTLPLTEKLSGILSIPPLSNPVFTQ